MKYHIPLTRGHLEVNSPMRILASAAVRRVTGSLTFSRHRCIKQIFLRNGEIVGASSNQPSESLGTLLLCNGVITTEAYSESLALMDRSEKRHGEILVSLGALPAEKLPAMLRLQHLTRLTDAITWPRGVYEFRECEPPKTNESFALWLVFQSALFHKMGREKIIASAQQHKNAIVTQCRSVLDPLIVESPELFETIGVVNNVRTVSALAKGKSNQMLFYTNLLIMRELGIINFKKPTVDRKAA